MKAENKGEAGAQADTRAVVGKTKMHCFRAALQQVSNNLGKPTFLKIRLPRQLMYFL